MNAINPSNPRRRRTVLLLLLVFTAIGGAAGWWYLSIGQWRETTQNAFLAGNLVTVGAERAGAIARIVVEENQTVNVGQPLAALIGGDALAQLDMRRQELAMAVQEIRARRAQVERARSELALRAVTQRLAEDEYQRRLRLSERKVLAAEELDAARTRAEETAGERANAERALVEAQVRAGEGPIAEQPMITRTAAGVRAAWRDWRKTQIVSPVDGRVSRRRVQIGEHVNPGTPMFSIVQRDAFWVEANFKENQLRNLRTGQPVRLVSDLYGEEFPFKGRVSGIGSGTGAVFSVLPPQNATGNWIKIVQRVPVRIEFETPPDAEHPLPLGASVSVAVDTHDRSGSRLPAAPPTDTSGQSATADPAEDGVDAFIAAIITGASAQTPRP